MFRAIKRKKQICGITIVNHNFTHADKSKISDPEDNKQSNGAPELRTKQFSKLLPPEIIKKLYQLYIIDFEMFGYNLDGILENINY